MLGAKRLQAALCEQVKGTEHKGLKKGKNAFHCPVSIFVSREWCLEKKFLQKQNVTALKNMFIICMSEQI